MRSIRDTIGPILGLGVFAAVETASIACISRWWAESEQTELICWEFSSSTLA